MLHSNRSRRPLKSKVFRTQARNRQLKSRRYRVFRPIDSGSDSRTIRVFLGTLPNVAVPTTLQLDTLANFLHPWEVKIMQGGHGLAASFSVITQHALGGMRVRIRVQAAWSAA